MDPATDDQRAAALGPRLAVDEAGPDAAAWRNPETGTTCRLEADGEYVVHRRADGARTVPVVAGRLRLEDAERVLADPESTTSRRAAAHAIVAVDR